MKLKSALGPVLAGIFLATPAFAQIIDKTVLDTTIAVSDELVRCDSVGNWSGSYANIGDPRTRISVALDSGELSWLPVLKHFDAAVIKDAVVCPSLKEIVGEISAEGTANVKITRILQKVKLPTYSNCKNQRLDEKIELKFSTGAVLTSRATHALSSDCGQLN